jgi:lipopolysaccharide assembly outer membrane protein LptD (OstA)
MRLSFLITFLAMFSTNAFAKTVHWSADRSRVLRQDKIVELKGNARFSRDEEELFADEIEYDQEKQSVKAKGRVQYRYGGYYIKADELEIDLESKSGTIINGNITNGSFALRGSQIRQLDQDHILVKDFDYTTCIDCPNSWSLKGDDVDFTIEGYAFIKDFVFTVKDSPMFWLPYMVVPVKTKRQSGILFPRFGVNDIHGIYAVQPAYWAINDWSDMTLGAGYYSRRGSRFEWEGRYTLSERSKGSANFYLTGDHRVNGLNNRYAGKLSLTQELPFHFEAKLRANEVSDSSYPITYSEDVPGRYEPVLASDLFLSRNDPNVSTVLSFRRIRNLLHFDSTGKFINEFDSSTVQEYPRIVVNSNNRFLLGSNIAAGFEARLNGFSRAAGPFDVIKTGGSSTVNVIREANRFTFIPSLYTTLNPWPWLSLVPSLQYRGFVYNFNNAPDYPNLARGYLLAQAEASFQLEKVIPTDRPEVSFKHTIRPMLTYSSIPVVQESENHPFFSQIQQEARPGQYFDYWDIVPLGTSQNLDSYYIPLGNSLTYGVTTQLLKKEKTNDASTSVSRRLELKATQTLNILELKKDVQPGTIDKRIPLSPLFTQFSYSDNRFSLSAEYIYYAFLNRYQSQQILAYYSPHRFNASLNMTFEKGLHQGVLQYDRSLRIGYSFAKLISKVSSLTTELHFSINDYIMPKVTYVFDLMSKPNQVLDSRYSLLFQNPSRCWSLETGYFRSIDRGSGFNISFALNIAGGGMGSIEEQLRNQ